MLKLLADHNRWMNEKLYAACNSILDEERKRDLGAFFHSIHGTLNHLLLVDRLWLGRVRNVPFHIESLGQELYRDFETLKGERSRTDSEISSLIAELSPQSLAREVAYTSFLKSGTVTLPLGLILTHMFHHQTHHRGQVTTLVSQLGYDFGVSDMIYMPGAGTEYFCSTSSIDSLSRDKKEKV